jgi:molecular chaperone GrpE (heat shock protein)
MDILSYIVEGRVVINVVICVSLLAALKESSAKSTKALETVRDLRTVLSKQKSGGSGGENANADLAETIKKYDKHFSVIASTLAAFQTGVDKGMKRMDQDMVRIESLVSGMRDYLTEYNEQLSRLQEGYDYSVLKRVVKPVIQVANGIESLEPRMKGQPEGEELRTMWLDLLDALETNGIERLQVEKGDTFADIRKIAEATTVKEHTTNADQVGKVAEVVRPGYCYVYNQDKRRLVVPAQVKLFDKVEG